MKEAKAKLKYVHIAPRKMRLIADLIRGASFNEAKAQISFSAKKSAEPLLKLLKSAESNARHNLKTDSDLYIKEIKIDEGPILKRFKARARGRAAMIRRRTSHVSVVLQEEPKKLKS